MSLKSNFEYIRDWCNFRFLKKDDQVKVDLSNYPTKTEVESALNESGAWVVNDPSYNYSGVRTKNGGNVVGGSCAVAEGRSTSASGSNSHAEGYGTQTYGTNSHAEGYYAQANGYASHAEGYNTCTNNTGEHAGGNYNYSTSGQTTFSHGIGTSSSSKNAIEIMSNGDMFVYGIGDYVGNNSSSSRSLQSILSNLDEDFVSVDQYQNDEEVIAAALNDLNSRLIFPKIADAITLPSSSSPLNVNSYVNWDESTVWKVRNGFEKKIVINNASWDYGTYGGYTGHFYYNNGKIYVFGYDSINDMFTITWINGTN